MIITATLWVVAVLLFTISSIEVVDEVVEVGALLILCLVMYVLGGL